MPKRIIDGDGLWRSEKLSQVNPPAYRAEYANLLPLALANGSFEADPRLIWATVYAYNRPDVSLEMVESVIAEFMRVKMLFIWHDARTGKQWGYWIGIEKPGRLPGESRRGTNERVGETPPAEQLRKFLDSNYIHETDENAEKQLSAKESMDSNFIHTETIGNEKLLGFGFGFGFGSGLGSRSGGASVDSESDSVSADGMLPDSEAKLLKLAKCHPQAHKIAQDQLPYDLVTAMIDAICLEASEQSISQDKAFEYLVGRAQLYAAAVAKWPAAEKRFAANHVRWYTEHQYRDDPVTWQRGHDAGSRPAQAQPVARSTTPLSERLNQGATHAN